MSKIDNGSSRLLNTIAGSIPNMSGALRSYFQPITFVPVQKTLYGFQVVESALPINFIGVIQPFTTRQLLLKPEGQRAWTWYTLHAEPGVFLQVDACFEYLGKQYRVMGRKDYKIYGYVEYEIVEDYTGAGP